MGFKAAQAFDKLDWDFRPITEAYGETPEPSAKQIREFQSTFRMLQDKLGFGDSPNSPENQRELLGAIEQLTEEDIAEIDDELNAALAKLTSGSPSFEQLKELQETSFRHHRAYIGSLMGDIMDPEASSAVIDRSQAAKNGATRTTSRAKN